MKIFKFRVWDKTCNTWVENCKIFQYGNVSSCEVWLTPSEQVIQQYTNILDKNQKEIYEGDIVKCGYGIGEVIFNAGCFMVQWICDPEANMELLFSRKGTYRRTNDEMFEVIGNIFENPELL